MMSETAIQPVVDFCLYPNVGEDDWRYTFETAAVRAMETAMLSRSVLVDMANAGGFDQALDLLSSTEYSIGAGKGFSAVQQMLLDRRSAVRSLFADLMSDSDIIELFKSRNDYANLRLAVRRTAVDKELGEDYNSEGNVPIDELAEAFKGDNFGIMPDSLSYAAEQAVLVYYQDKDVRQIDFVIDAAQAMHNIETAQQLNSIFLEGLFRVQVDLTNIRTMFRLKLTESENRNVFIDGGYVEMDMLKHGIDMGTELLAPAFFASPYYEAVQAGAGYFTSDHSFLKLEQQCEAYLNGFLRSTGQITAGPQPVIAYLLLKENEIRTVRLILTAKKNNLDPKLILDRL